MLRVKLLSPDAKLPVVAHAGEDLGYDIYTVENVVLQPSQAGRKIHTGIAVEARHPETDRPLGLLIRDRSSLASRGLAITGGVVDAGYRGEILVVMNNLSGETVEFKAGEKIAQMVPVPVLTGEVVPVDDLQNSLRSDRGFGSSGK